MNWLARMISSSPSSSPRVRADPLVILEGVESVWSYHLADPFEGAIAGKKALCGRDRLMRTSMPLSAWGYRTKHIGEKFCLKCAQAALDRGISLPPMRDPV
jgi:hypothetical protein